MLNSISGSTAAVFGYDSDGNRTCEAASSCSSPSNTYTFDAVNRMTSWSASLNTVDYLYDGNGLLQQETNYQQCCAPPQTSRWATTRGDKRMQVPIGQGRLGSSGSALHRIQHGIRKDSLPTLTLNLTWNTALGSPTLATLNPNNGSHTNFLYGPEGEPLEQIWYNTSGVVQPAEYYYQDLAGNTRELIDQSGSVQASYNYPPYGVTESYIVQEVIPRCSMSGPILILSLVWFTTRLAGTIHQLGSLSVKIQP